MNKNSQNSIDLLGYNIYSNQLEEINFLGRKKLIINTINPHSYCVAKKDMHFDAALKRSDIIIPDGVGIVLSAKVLVNKKLSKIAGADLHLYLLQRMNKIGGSVFYLGASEETLELIKRRASHEYPQVKVNAYSPPYKSHFTDDDNEKMRGEINRIKPDVLFVGMTAPKQEKWSDSNIEFLDVGIITSIGAVFDFYAGTVKRPGKFWIKIGLEWFPRFCREPRRLWRRTLISTPLFVLDVIRDKIKAKRLVI